MTPTTVGTLLFRLLGAAFLTYGVLSIFGFVVSYFYVANEVALHDTYFVIGESLTWAGILIATGALFLIFSRTFGRWLSRGLPPK